MKRFTCSCISEILRNSRWSSERELVPTYVEDTVVGVHCKRPGDEQGTYSEYMKLWMSSNYCPNCGKPSK